MHRGLAVTVFLVGIDTLLEEEGEEAKMTANKREQAVIMGRNSKHIGLPLYEELGKLKPAMVYGKSKRCLTLSGSDFQKCSVVQQVGSNIGIVVLGGTVYQRCRAVSVWGVYVCSMFDKPFNNRFVSLKASDV